MPARTQLFQLLPWIGGVNTSQDDSLIPPNQLVRADNCIFDTKGSRNHAPRGPCSTYARRRQGWIKGGIHKSPIQQAGHNLHSEQRNQERNQRIGGGIEHIPFEPTRDRCM